MISEISPIVIFVTIFNTVKTVACNFLYLASLKFNKAKKKICGFPVSRPYLAFGRQNPDPKLFYCFMLESVST